MGETINININPSDVWRIQDSIKHKVTKFSVGEVVSLFCKRSDGYPRYLDIGDTGKIISIEMEHLTLDFTGISITKQYTNNKINYLKVKIAKKYFISVPSLRDFRINKILS